MSRLAWLGSLLILGTLTPQEPDPRVKLNELAPAFALNDLDGHRRRSGELWGKRGSLLFFVGRQRGANALAKLAALRREFDFAGRTEVAVIIVDRRPGTSERLLQDYTDHRLSGVVLRDVRNEVARIYAARDRDKVYLLDEHHFVRFSLDLHQSNLRSVLEDWLGA